MKKNIIVEFLFFDIIYIMYEKYFLHRKNLERGSYWTILYEKFFLLEFSKYNFGKNEWDIKI